jgi:hypothetical protein
MPTGQLAVGLLALQVFPQKHRVRQTETFIAIASTGTAMIALFPVTTPPVFSQFFCPAKRALFLTIPPPF